MVWARLTMTASAESSSSVNCLSLASDRTRAFSSSGSTGFERKSSAPTLIPSIRCARSFSAVTSTTGVSRVVGSRLSRRHTSKPLSPGMTTSRRTTSGRAS